MNASTADFGSAIMGALLRALGLVALAVGAALTMVFAAVVAFAVAALIAGAALAMRLWPRRPNAGDGGVLEARHTAAGWVVEGANRRTY